MKRTIPSQEGQVLTSARNENAISPETKSTAMSHPIALKTAFALALTGGSGRFEAIKRSSSTIACVALSGVFFNSWTNPQCGHFGT
jgi:hypothetical protein